MTDASKSSGGIVADSVHVLLKVKSEGGVTIDAHAALAKRNGRAFMGKLGQPLGPAFSKELNEQIARGMTTFLFVTIREGWNGPYVTFRGALNRVTPVLQKSEYPLVPSYYKTLIPEVKTWLEITGLDRLSKDEMNRIVVCSSGRQIMSVVNSSATVFRVRLEPRRT